MLAGVGCHGVEIEVAEAKKQARKFERDLATGIRIGIATTYTVQKLRCAY